MTAFPEHREVRVTPRISITTPFIAPELSPVPLLDRELDKGLKGWTDFDLKVPDLAGDHRPAGLAERELDAFKAGTVTVRKAPGAARPVRSRYVNQGPSASRRAARKSF